jgi:transposase
MDHFREKTKILHGTHPAVLIADKAGCHQKRVCEQRGIALEHLPRGCPELNPVERFSKKKCENNSPITFSIALDKSKTICAGS